MFTPLDIKNSPKCLPYPWHPSVVYVSEKFGGHFFWMAQTPYPPMEIAPYRDRYELPCVHYSDDGVHWFPIFHNPIIDLAENDIIAHNYYSDPHLIIRDSQFELFFRFTILNNKQLEGNTTLLLRSYSTDGFNWSKTQTIADLRKKEDELIWGKQIISPALCWNGDGYQCWYVDKSSYMHNRNIRKTTSVDGEIWSQNRLCSFVGPAIDPWHIDVQYYDDMYQMIVYDMDKLLWYESLDGVHFQYVSEVLRPSSKRYDFYTDGLYRACSVKTEDRVLVYFSARRKRAAYIGLLSTRDRHHFMPVSGISLTKWLPIVWKPLLKAVLNRIIDA